MLRRVVLSTILLCAAASLLSAKSNVGRSLQELGLPGHIRFEGVFPQVVFGSFGEFSLEAEFTLVNPTDEEALVVMDYRTADGNVPERLTDELAGRQARLDYSEDDGWFDVTVDPLSVRKLYLPGRKVESSLAKEFPDLGAVSRSAAFVVWAQRLADGHFGGRAVRSSGAEAGDSGRPFGGADARFPWNYRQRWRRHQRLWAGIHQSRSLMSWNMRN